MSESSPYADVWESVPVLEPPGGVPEWTESYRERNLVVSASCGESSNDIKIHAPDPETPYPAPACDTLLLAEQGWNYFELLPANLPTLERCDHPACRSYLDDLEAAFRDADVYGGPTREFEREESDDDGADADDLD